MFGKPSKRLKAKPNQRNILPSSQIPRLITDKRQILQHIDLEKRRSKYYQWPFWSFWSALVLIVLTLPYFSVYGRSDPFLLNGVMLSMLVALFLGIYTFGRIVRINVRIKHLRKQLERDGYDS